MLKNPEILLWRKWTEKVKIDYNFGFYIIIHGIKYYFLMFISKVMSLKKRNRVAQLKMTFKIVVNLFVLNLKYFSIIISLFILYVLKFKNICIKFMS